MGKNTLPQLEKGIEILCSDAVDVISEKELLAKLVLSHENKKPLRIKYGADPSRPDLHLGHFVGLRKLRAFQEAGHTIVFIIGDFTACIGDPSGQNATRPALSGEEVKKNAETYACQIFKILDEKKTEVVFNSQWLNKISLDRLIRLSGCITVSRMLERDDFSKRYEKEIPIGLHEFLYPIIQAYDSVAIQADVEIGGTDQKFNLLVGRDMMRYHSMEPQVVLTFPLIEGTDGTQKMSKSLNNYIGLTEPPREIFGKLMSIPDTLILKYFRLLTDTDRSLLNRYEEQMKNNAVNPRDVKKHLAETVVDMLHGNDEAKKASRWFDEVFKEKKLSEEIEEIKLEKHFFSGHTVKFQDILISSRLAPSKSEAKRLIQQGAVEINNKKVAWDQLEGTKVHEGDVLRVGKKRVVRLTAQ